MREIFSMKYLFDLYKKKNSNFKRKPREVKSKIKQIEGFTQGLLLGKTTI